MTQKCLTKCTNRISNLFLCSRSNNYLGISLSVVNLSFEFAIKDNNGIVKKIQVDCAF